MTTCIDVATEAVRVGVNPALAVSLSWHETRLRPGLTSKAGAMGPLQVIPKFWCKSEPCDYVEAGLRALRFYLNKEPNDRKAICRYNAGTCKPKSWAWAGKVVQLTNQTRKIMEQQQ
jgi:soluble lytic murein transglycosylase-like protein